MERAQVIESILQIAASVLPKLCFISCGKCITYPLCSFTGTS